MYDRIQGVLDEPIGEGTHVRVPWFQVGEASTPGSSGALLLGKRQSVAGLIRRGRASPCLPLWQSVEGC